MLTLWNWLRSRGHFKAANQFTNQSDSLATARSRGENLSLDDVRDCYRILLGREPENDAVVAEALASHHGFLELRRSFLRSAEFRDFYKSFAKEEGDEHPYLSYSRRTIAFIHLIKTGGTTLHSLLEPHFARDRVWPVHFNNLHLYSAAELSKFDLFSGHFDSFSVSLIPRAQIDTISLFRDPRARLVSFYRFLKSHPPGWEFENNILVGLAHDLSADVFFEHPVVRSAPEVFNHYLLVFGLAYSAVNNGWPAKGKLNSRSNLNYAKQRVRTLTAIGITERFRESVDMIFKTLRLPVPSTIINLQVTDGMSDLNSKFSRVDPVPMTPRLIEAMAELTAFDNEIYHEALNEFERRLLDSKAARKA